MLNLKTLKDKNPNKNIRWVIWEIVYGKGLPTYEYICWINDKWNEFFKFTYGSIPKYLYITESIQEKFDNWLLDFIKEK